MTIAQSATQHSKTYEVILFLMNFITISTEGSIVYGYHSELMKIVLLEGLLLLALLLFSPNC